MRRIKMSYFKNFRNGEHVQLHGSIVSLLKEKLLGRLGLTALGNDYLAAFDTENVAYKNNATVVETKDVEEAVERRDAAFKRINFAVHSAALSENAEEEAAGRLLQNVFDSYKYVYQRSYMESAAEVTNLVGELMQPPYASAVERLGLLEAVETLSFRNEAFANLYNERSVARHDIQMRGTMPEIRRRVDKTYRALTEGINVLYAANELTGKNADVRRQLTNLIETINSFVEQAERVYNRRAGRTNDEKTSADAVEANHQTDMIPQPAATAQEVVDESPLQPVAPTQTSAKSAAADLPPLTPVAADIVFSKPPQSHGEPARETSTPNHLLATLESIAFPYNVRDA